MKKIFFFLLVFNSGIALCNICPELKAIQYTVNSQGSIVWSIPAGWGLIKFNLPKDPALNPIILRFYQAVWSRSTGRYFCRYLLQINTGELNTLNIYTIKMNNPEPDNFLSPVVNEWVSALDSNYICPEDPSAKIISLPQCPINF